jgi:hypothetical protein
VFARRSGVRGCEIPPAAPSVAATLLLLGQRLFDNADVELVDSPLWRIGQKERGTVMEEAAEN